MYNILFISHFAGMNGAPKSLLGLLNNLDRSKYHLYVILPDHGLMEKELINKNIDYFIIHFRVCVWKDTKIRHSLQEYIDFYFSEFIAVKKICGLIRRLKIDIIHTNSSVCDVGAIAAICMRKGHVWHVREFITDDFGWKLISLGMQRLLMKRSYVICNSKATAKMARDRYRVRTRVIYNGMNCFKYYAEVHGRYRVGTVNLMIVGDVQEGKGQEEVVRAIDMLREKGYEACLYIIGNVNAQYAKRIRNFINEKNLGRQIKWFQHVDDLKELRKINDVTVVCSRCEALGRVTIESMLAGVPVIGSNSGGTKELIGLYEERGYLYEQGNVNDLAEKIEWFILHEEEAKNKAMKAQHFAINMFNMDKYVKKIEEVYFQCIK